MLLLVSLAELVLRGPVRFARARDFSDFISPYTQTRAWMKGLDPYSPANLVGLWPDGAQRFDFLQKDLADGSLVLKRGIPTAYPPTTFVLLAPIAALPYRVAHAVWLLMSFLACVGSVLALASLVGFHRDQPSTYIFCAIAFALAPFHTGLAAGSIVIVAVAACALSTWAAARQNNIAAGILLAVAIGLKPQIGLPFLFYYLLRRRWRVVGLASAIVAVLAVIAILYLSLHHTPWLGNYRYDGRILFARGSLGDFTEANPIRFGLINLQVLVYTFLPDRSLATLAAFGICGIMCVWWLLLLRRNRSSAPELLELELLEIGALTVLSLLPVYHRLYDASLLIFPLAWSLSALNGNLKAMARATLALVLFFLIPGGSALEQLQRSNYLGGLQHSWLWIHVIMPHQIWILVSLGVILLLAMRRSACVPRDAMTPAHG